MIATPRARGQSQQVPVHVVRPRLDEQGQVEPLVGQTGEQRVRARPIQREVVVVHVQEAHAVFDQPADLFVDVVGRSQQDAPAGGVVAEPAIVRAAAPGDQAVEAAGRQDLVVLAAIVVAAHERAVGERERVQVEHVARDLGPADPVLRPVPEARHVLRARAVPDRADQHDQAAFGLAGEQEVGLGKRFEGPLRVGGCVDAAEDDPCAGPTPAHRLGEAEGGIQDVGEYRDADDVRVARRDGPADPVELKPRGARVQDLDVDPLVLQVRREVEQIQGRVHLLREPRRVSRRRIDE